MPLDLLSYRCRKPVFGQLDEETGVEDQSHHRTIDEDDERKDHVKFLREHLYFSATFLNLLQDEAPIFIFILSARLLMSIFYMRIQCSLIAVLWADDRSKPCKNIYGGRP